MTPDEVTDISRRIGAMGVAAASQVCALVATLAEDGLVDPRRVAERIEGVMPRVAPSPESLEVFLAVMKQSSAQLRDIVAGAAKAEAPQQPDTPVATLRAEIAALRQEVNALRWEAAGGAWASVIPAAAIVATLAETGSAEPLAVAAWVDRLALGAKLRPEGRQAIEMCLAQFTEILRALPALMAGTWRAPHDEAPKAPPRLRVVRSTAD